MSSIYKIAEEAGVSPSTVSRALNGTGYCSTDTRDRILAIAKNLGYVPSHAARALKSQRTNKILICIPDICNPFYFRLIEGITKVLEAEQYLPILCPTQAKLANELRMIQFLEEKYGDGMIFISFDFNETIVKSLNESKHPIVVTNRIPQAHTDLNFDIVYVDTYEGIRIATRHLIHKSPSDIAYLGGSLKTQTGQERYQGFIDEMQEAGISLQNQQLMEGDFSLDSGTRAMDESIAKGYVPTAMVVANDLMAAGVLKACHNHGVEPPELVGMDDGEMSEAFGFSSIKMQEDDIGLKSAQILMARIKGNNDPHKSVRLMPELHIR